MVAGGGLILPEGRQSSPTEEALGQVVMLLQNVAAELDLLIRMECGALSRKTMLLKIKEADAKAAAMVEQYNAQVAAQNGSGPQEGQEELPLDAQEGLSLVEDDLAKDLDDDPERR